MTAFSERPDSIVIDDEFEDHHRPAAAPGDYDLEDRQALRRVSGLSTELEDVTEVEYRSLRLEQVVLIGVWAEGSLASAENSLLELSRLQALEQGELTKNPPGRKNRTRAIFAWLLASRAAVAEQSGVVELFACVTEQ